VASRVNQDPVYPLVSSTSSITTTTLTTTTIVIIINNSSLGRISSRDLAMFALNVRGLLVPGNKVRECRAQE